MVNNTKKIPRDAHFYPHHKKQQQKQQQLWDNNNTKPQHSRPEVRECLSAKGTTV